MLVTLIQRIFEEDVTPLVQPGEALTVRRLATGALTVAIHDQAGFDYWPAWTVLASRMIAKKQHDSGN